jgi:predicted nuclease of restriction endonuclease-like RecB superfamily
VLTKDLLRVSRRGGGYRPHFVDREDRPLAARVIGTYQGHVGETRADLEGTLDDLEAEPEVDFKLVRGLAALLDREAVWETDAPLPPERVRRVAFECAEAVDVASEAERTAAIEAAADRLAVDLEAVERSLYADREPRQVLAAFDPRWNPDALLAQYDLSLAQTALFDATEVRVRSSDPKAVVSAVKRLGLMYEVRRPERHRTAGEDRRVDADPADGSGDGAPGTREVVVSGPDTLFRRTRRYGTGFARLLRTVAATHSWELRATIDDRGREREMTLTDADVSVPGVEPVAEPTYDSGVERDFAARFSGLDLDWELVREPDPLVVDGGTRVMIPDFAFDYSYADFRVYFEIMGFWTPEYVEKKLSQLAGVEDVELLVAVDESLGVGEAIEARDHRAIPYTDSVRLKDVVDVLRRYEEDLVADAADALSAELIPDADVVALEDLAAEFDVGVEAVESKSYPRHERVGRTLVRPAVLDDLRGEVEPGMALSETEATLDEYGIDDASAALSRLGYRVEWEGLAGGTIRAKGDGSAADAADGDGGADADAES